MTILAIDDERTMLLHLKSELEKVFPHAELLTFDECDEVLTYLDAPQSRAPQYAFLDIKLRGMLGIELARRIREHCPQTRIIFLHGLLRLRAGGVQHPGTGLSDETCH